MNRSIFKAVCILTLVCFVMSTTGAAATTASSGKVVQITQPSQINSALSKGPVFLRLGASWCSHCKAFDPTLQTLAKKYSGKVTFMSGDITKSPKLITYFGVRVIPDCCVIVGIQNGKYIYMQQNGKTTTVRANARIIGDKSISVYEKILNYAIKYKK
jgi:thiol-disulfide isomerase/thioredoxin